MVMALFPIYKEAHCRDRSVRSFVARESRKHDFFHVLYALTYIFKRVRLPLFILKKAFRFTREHYIHLALFYYLKDTDDVGLAEIFFLDNDDVDKINRENEKDYAELNRAYRLSSVYSGKEKDDREVDNLSTDFATTKKKLAWAKQSLKETTTLECFAFRIMKINERLYKRVSELYRILRDSLYKRDKAFLLKEENSSPDLDLSMIVQMVIDGF